jgi:hypothetical protein
MFQTLHKTMCEETVFWDLNYSIKFKSLGTEDIRTKVLKVIAAAKTNLAKKKFFFLGIL